MCKSLCIVMALVYRILSWSLIGSVLMNNFIIPTANAQDETHPAVKELMSVSCEQLQVILEKRIQSMDVMNDLKILLQFSFYRQDCWSHHSRECSVDVKQQSPININTKKVVYYNFPPLVLDNANVSIDYGMIGNIYRAVQFRVTELVVPVLRGGPISTGVPMTFFDMMLLTDIDVNCNTPPCEGSSHAINGQKYVAELIIEWTEKKSTKMTDYLNHRLGETLVTSFLIQIQEHDNPAWDPIILPFITRHDNCPILPQDYTGFRYKSLLSLLPSTDDWIDHYYTYDGSDTCAPCHDVKYIIFADPIYISQAQLAILQSVKDENGQRIKNVRQLQPINKATKVYTTIGCHVPLK